MAASADTTAPQAASPYTLLDEVERARDVLVLTYTASLEFFERFALASARSLGALVSVVSDATMVRADPVSVRRAGVHYLDARAVCPNGTAFHPKLLVIVGDGQARVAIGSGNLTMAGWHANAETWTVLRTDAEGGPDTVRDVSAFLRALSDSDVDLSAGAPDALRRVADELDLLPAEQPGPRLLHSLHTSIVSQLPELRSAVSDLVLYAPFHDGRLDGVNDLLDRLQPAEWTAFVQPDTVIDGPALARLAAERGGRVAWVDRRPDRGDGNRRRDERYWHGKLAQWRLANGETWTLTGSPNLSRPALLRAIGDGGNCELATLARVDYDLRPPQGEAPPGGLASLRRPSADGDGHRGPVLLAAVASELTVRVQLHRPLDGDGLFERYDVCKDRWTATGPVAAGHAAYDLDVAQAPVGSALRLRADAGTVSNEVFVADPRRLARRQHRTIGKARTSPEEIARDGLGPQLLADVEELRAHLLAIGATVTVSRAGAGDSGDDNDTDQVRADSDAPLPARPASGQTLDEYLEACDPVLGRSMTEFALVLPALPGVGATLDDQIGTLDSDTDEDAAGELDEAGDAELSADGTASDDDEVADPPLGLTGRLQGLEVRERERYRAFVERLVDRMPGYPPVVRALAVRTLLHAIVAGLWPDERWPPVLGQALKAFTAPGDEPRDEERLAIGSLAAVGLALLRTDVPRMSQRDERQLRYVGIARAVSQLLLDRDGERIELLTAGLPGQMGGPAGAAAVEHAVDEVLHPPRGPARAVRLLSDEADIAAHTSGEATLVLDEPVDDRFPDPQLIQALSLAEDAGPVFVRALTGDGRPVLAAWCAPWLAVERTAPSGKTHVRAWRSPAGLHPLVGRFELPKMDASSFASQARPTEVAALLELADDDGSP